MNTDFFFFLLKCRISAKASYSGRRILYKVLEIRFSKKKKNYAIKKMKNEKWEELKKWVLEMVRNREMLPEREEKRRWDFVEEIGFGSHQTHCQFNIYLLRFDLLKWKRRPFSFSHVTFYQLPPFRVFFFFNKIF